MKRVCICILFTLMLSVSAAVIGSAETEADLYCYQDGCYEITVERGNLSDEQLATIAAKLAGAETASEMQTRGLWCTLFGHDYETTTATKITHKKYATSPRCLLETYDVKVCTKCDETTETLIESSRIICCP